MTNTIIKYNQNTAIEVFGPNNNWMVNPSVTVKVSDGSAIFGDESDDVGISIKGKVQTLSDEAAIDMTGLRMQINVGSHGKVIGGSGMELHGYGMVTNAGEIFGQLDGIAGGGIGGSLTNSGLVVGETGAGVHYSYGDVTVENLSTGIIKGRIGVHIASAKGDEVEVENIGLIQGRRTALQFGSADDELTNHGRIKGAVFMGDGDDVIDLVGGKIDGLVHGDKGNDIYYLDKNAAPIVENIGEGSDVAYVSHDFTLAGNVSIDIITALGEGDIKLKGNNLANFMVGNEGDNTLHGAGGDDLLNGDTGDDVLIGGAGDDTFDFGDGSGHDIIVDFQTDEGISLYVVDILSFNDLQGYMSQQGDDVVIALTDDDTLTIKDVEASSLSSGNFYFY